MSTPRENADSEAEPQRDGLRDEIEEILREQGEKPVQPRPPSARDGGPLGIMAGLLRGSAGGDSRVLWTGARTIMRATMLLLLLRLGMTLVFAFFAVRVFGPRAILLFIVIALAILALIVARRRGDP